MGRKRTILVTIFCTIFIISSQTFPTDFTTPKCGSFIDNDGNGVCDNYGEFCSNEYCEAAPGNANPHFSPIIYYGVISFCISGVQSTLTCFLGPPQLHVLNLQSLMFPYYNNR